jgi:hypothetical protein
MNAGESSSVVWRRLPSRLAADPPGISRSFLQLFGQREKEKKRAVVTEEWSALFSQELEQKSLDFPGANANSSMI